jgi:phosphopantothenoylcysteine decarboxylase/phosphopantothenate--cysteine ligase
MRAKDLKNLTVLVTAGPTRERLDPVRYISNFSSGKMGYAIAENALARGADVILVSGPVSIEPPRGAKLIKVESTLDLLREMTSLAPKSDIVIQSAAPSDYRPAYFSETKIKKQPGSGEDLVIRMVENPDVAATIGKDKRDDQIFVAFAAETNDGIKNARDKMLRKNADMIILNDVTKAGAGFGVDTNIATIITKDHIHELEIMPKLQLAVVILDNALSLLEKKRKSSDRHE